MHMPVRYMTPKYKRPSQSAMPARTSQISNISYESVCQKQPRHESHKKIVNININIESEDEPVVNINWMKKPKKQVRFNQNKSMNLDDVASQVSQVFSNGFDTTFSQIKLLNQTENSEPGIDKPFISHADFMKQPSKRSILEQSFSKLTSSNINRISTKRKLSLGSFQCQKPQQALNEIRNIQNPNYKFEKIQDQLKGMADTRAYRYEQLISRAKKSQGKKYRLAQEDTQEMFLGCLGQGGWTVQAPRR